MTDLKRGDDWISIDDAVPKFKDSYLAVEKKPWGSTEIRVVLFCPVIGFYENGKVTHWQPLPPLPEGDDNATD